MRIDAVVQGIVREAEAVVTVDFLEMRGESGRYILFVAFHFEGEDFEVR